MSDWLSPGEGQAAPLHYTFAGGACAATAYWCSVYPFDMVKSRIQTMGMVETFGTVFAHEYRKRGFLGLYQGIGVTLLRAVIAGGLKFFAYEYSKKLLDSVI